MLMNLLGVQRIRPELLFMHDTNCDARHTMKYNIGRGGYDGISYLMRDDDDDGSKDALFRLRSIRLPSLPERISRDTL